jgi:hypothetical protein
MGTHTTTIEISAILTRGCFCVLVISNFLKFLFYAWILHQPSVKSSPAHIGVLPKPVFYHMVSRMVWLSISKFWSRKRSKKNQGKQRNQNFTKESEKIVIRKLGYRKDKGWEIASAPIGRSGQSGQGQSHLSVGPLILI